MKANVSTIWVALVIVTMFYKSVASFTAIANSRRFVGGINFNGIMRAITHKSDLPKWMSTSCNDDEKEMVKVSFETSTRTKTILIQKGEVLRSAMMRRGTSVHNDKARLINCRGLGTCGTCAVEINCNGNENAIEPMERNTREKVRLNFYPHGSNNQSSNLRLACQVQVNGDICVTKRSGFWGQDSEDLAEEYDAQLYFGELEYILDDRSPSSMKNEDR
jgi:ferredoxin